MFEAPWQDLYLPRSIGQWDASRSELGISKKKSENSSEGARQEFLPLDDPIAGAYLRQRKSLFCPQDAIWTFSPAVWNTRFQTLLTFLGTKILIARQLVVGQVEPHTIVCFVFFHLFSSPRLRPKGKWASDKSLDHYV